MSNIGPDHWKSYFDKRYFADLQQFQRIIDDEGEVSLVRAISKFNRWTEEFEVVLDEDADTFVISPKDWGDVPRLPTGLPVFLDMWAMGVDFRAPPYLKAQIDKFLIDYIQQAAPDVDSVVEIGAGWGRNLFDLWHAGLGAEIELLSADSAKNAATILTKLKTLDPALPINPVPFDISAPDFSFSQAKRHVLYFSYFTMMYASELDDAFFLRLIDANPNATFIHFEPVGFQLNKVQSHVARVQEVEAQLRNYNQNLMDILIGLRDKGVINLTHAYKDLLPYRHRAHAISVVIWNSKR